ncbi:hypothetical protein Nepgr_010121 [Nepenthes gracilis]|uniref:Pentatricopeptide repeat-containing protein n=1 Tax=Nepenthes gracilis TaxID=150966 RepID=A0AAD3XL28_NEPGR|nr:hypothetical protein Nepgr_010121 [Nepenthes gracilis]
MPLARTLVLTFRFSQAFKLGPVLALQFAQELCLSTPKWLKQIHTATTLVNLKPLNYKLSNCMRNGLVDEAQKLFDKMPQRNTVTWNAMIRGYFQNGRFDYALHLFYQMPSRDIFSYNTVICGLMKWGDVTSAKEVFEKMPCKDVVSWNSMISGFILNGLMDEAIRVFNMMPEKDVVSWNLVIGGLVNSEEFDVAEKLFYEMSTRDAASWTIMVSGLVRSGNIVEARELFEQMPGKDIKAWNTIIAGYVEHGDIENAELLFQRMPEQDFNSSNTLINGLIDKKRLSDAVRLFSGLLNKCQKLWNSVLLGAIRNGLVQEAHAFVEKNPISDIVSSTNIIVGYFGVGEVEAAVKMFELMLIRDTPVWNATIFGLGEHDRGEEGLKLFIRMRESGQYTDDATFTSVLKICSDLSSLHLGKQIHAQVIKMGFGYFTSVSNAMVTMYARCGNMNSAILQFTSMRTRDVISWNSIICGFAYQGDGEKALEMFKSMMLADVQPNHITFVGVLSACSHAGLIDEGKFYFDFMRYKYLIQPTSKHYTCLVDMLGRNGLIGEAMTFLESIAADGIEVPASVWGALLGACRMYNNIEIGKVAGERVLEIEPYNSGVYLILAEMYMRHGRVAEAKKIWVQMKDRRVKRQPGCSWIEVSNIGYVFLAGDFSHPEFGSMCLVLDLLHMEIEIFLTIYSSHHEIIVFNDGYDSIVSFSC